MLGERNNDESRCLSKCIEKQKFYCILEGCPKDVQQQHSASIQVGDAVGNEQITDMWHHHFSEILNSVHNTDSKSFVCDHIDSVSPKSKMLIDASAIIESLKEIKLGKSVLFIRTVAFSTFIYMYVESWACSDSMYENFNYSYSKKQKR